MSSVKLHYIIAFFIFNVTKLNFAIYSYGSGTIFPAEGILINCSNVSFTIAVCISTLLGSPALAPIGTLGATALGVPVCLTTGGRAAIIIVGIPAFSIALCTKTADL